MRVLALLLLSACVVDVSAGDAFHWKSLDGDGKADGGGSDGLVVTDGPLAGVAITRVDPTASGPLTQDHAAAMCDALVAGGFDDWQLPPEATLNDIGTAELAALPGFGNVDVWSDFVYVDSQDLGDNGVGFLQGQTATMTLGSQAWTRHYFDPNTPDASDTFPALCVRADHPLPDYRRCYQLATVARCLCLGSEVETDFECN